MPSSDHAMRNVGTALLLGGVLVSTSARRVARMRASVRAARAGVMVAIDRPGTLLMECGIALLNVSSALHQQGVPPGRGEGTAGR